LDVTRARAASRSIVGSDPAGQPARVPTSSPGMKAR
jgi:hypothetical protein